jgi:hypothetical protein
MMATHPPRLATWVLEHFVSGPRRESLVGDLLEQYPRRRSAVWYWRQVLAAIVGSVARDLSAHKRLAVRAVAVGWLAYAVLSVPVHWLAEMVSLQIRDWIVTSGHYAFWPVFLAGPLSATVCWCLAGVTIGWMVARLHRRHAVAVVCLFSASVLVFECGFTALMLSLKSHPPMSPAVLLLLALMAMGTPMSVLIGGLWQVPEKGSLSGAAAD